MLNLKNYNSSSSAFVLILHCLISIIGQTIFLNTFFWKIISDLSPYLSKAKKNHKTALCEELALEESTELS